MGSHAIALNFSKKLDSIDWLFHTGFEEIRFLKWRDAFNSDSWFLAILKGFSEGLPLYKPIFFFLKIKKDFNKDWYPMSQVFIRVLDPPTYLHKFDANRGKIRYVSDP